MKISKMTVEQMHRVCLKKKRYFNREHAEKRADEYESRRKVKLYVYQCPLCGHFHLTRIKQRGR